jgi:hypothetical protein
MPTQPQAARSAAIPTTKGKAAARSKPAPLPKSAPTERGTSDDLYGVVSVLYHALQGAETYDEYADDAREAGDSELVTFFEECREEELRRAERAKALLADRLEPSGAAEDEDEDEDDDDEDEDDDDEEEDDEES